MRLRTIVLAVALGLAAWPGALVAQEGPGAAAQPDTVFTQPPLSPAGAFFRSLVLPGWAQAELGHEARGAFYFFAESFSLFMIARTVRRLNHAERTLPEDSDVISSRKQQREDWIALAVFWAFFSAADAWVSVQLFGFEERTELGPKDVALRVDWRDSAFWVGWQIPVGP